MKKSNKLLLTSSGLLSTFAILPFAILSCDNKAKILKQLNEYVEKEFDLKIDAWKYTIDEALDINKYINNLKSGCKFNLKSITKNNNKVEVKYTITDLKNNVESNEFSKEFSGFKDKPVDPSEKYDATKNRDELISLFEITKTTFASTNVAKFVNNKENTHFKLSEVKVIEYDDSLGALKASIKGKYNNFDFQDEFTINDFKKPLISLNSMTLNAKLNINKLIEEKKTFDDLKTLTNSQLLAYIEELKGLDENGNQVDVLDLLRDTNYKINSLKISNGTKFNLAISVSYKKKAKNAAEVVESKQIANYVNRDFEKTTFGNEEIAKYLLTKIKETAADKTEFASSYVSDFYRRNINVAPTLAKLPDEFEKAYGADIIYVDTISVKANDITGELHLQYCLTIEKGSEKYRSATKETTIKGFKKVDENTIRNFTVGPKVSELSDQQWLKLKADIKKLYEDNGSKPDFKITDSIQKAKFFRYANGNDTWNVIKEGTTAKDASVYTENGHWEFFTNGVKASEDFDRQRGLFNMSKFQVKTVSIKFVEISNFRKRNNLLLFDYIFEIRFQLHSSSSASTDEDTTLIKKFAYSMWV